MIFQDNFKISKEYNYISVSRNPWFEKLNLEKKLYKIHTSRNSKNVCSSYFFFPLFFFARNSQILIRHFSRESVDPSIKFSNLPIKSFHYKSIIRSTIVSRFHLRGFYPKNHTARQFSASCYELQNRDARPSDRGIFRMEQWIVAQKGWRDIGEGKRICVGR